MLRCLLFVFALLVSVNAQTLTTSRTIIVFGDSITAGNALPKDQQDRLWLKLVEQKSAGTLTLVNEGKGGPPPRRCRNSSRCCSAVRRPMRSSSPSA